MPTYLVKRSGVPEKSLRHPEFIRAVRAGHVLGEDEFSLDEGLTWHPVRESSFAPYLQRQRADAHHGIKTEEARRPQIRSPISPQPSVSDDHFSWRDRCDQIFKWLPQRRNYLLAGLALLGVMFFALPSLNNFKLFSWAGRAPDARQQWISEFRKVPGLMRQVQNEFRRGGEGGIWEAFTDAGPKICAEAEVMDALSGAVDGKSNRVEMERYNQALFAVGESLQTMSEIHTSDKEALFKGFFSSISHDIVNGRLDDAGATAMALDRTIRANPRIPTDYGKATADLVQALRNFATAKRIIEIKFVMRET